MYQKRLKKERKQRQQVQEQLEMELKRRQKIEEALKQSGAPGEILRIVTGKFIKLFPRTPYTRNQMQWESLVFPRPKVDYILLQVFNVHSQFQLIYTLSYP